MEKMSVSDFEIVVIGAGPAGLCAAIEAQRAGRSVVVLEADEEAGGLTRSFEQDGYTFDCSGHLLHLSHPDAVALVEEVTTPEDWNRIPRNSVIYLGETIIPYPFQQHLAYAPEAVRRECIEELPAASPQPGTDFANFGEWIHANLGDGIGRSFMVPYNEKLSTASVEELTCDWLGRFVPQPSLEEIRRGAEERKEVETGYNRSFLYPSRHGIATLSRGLASLVEDLRVNTRVSEIDTEAKLVRSEDGSVFSYVDGVVATAPLPQLCAMVTPTLAGVEETAKLRANTVTCVNLGLKQANPEFSQYQWIYLPEGQFAAYRLGFYARFAETMAPPGRESVYVEIAHDYDAEEGEVVAAAIADMVRLGAIESEGDVETVLPVRIEGAYVIHDRHTAPTRALLHEALAERGILTAGRYATWEYSAMEDAIVQGLTTTRQLLGAPAEAGSPRA
jgi:protoporphyrinogen oxidase